MPTLITAGDATSAASSFTASNDGALNLVVGPAGGKLTALSMDAAGALTTVAGRRVFSQGNILGTVSQAAGVPTGAVIERGSNANGEFVRFADGTQICTKHVPELILAGAASAVTISPIFNYPAGFAGLIARSYSGYVTEGGGARLSICLAEDTPSRTDQWAFCYFNHTSTAATRIVQVSLIAIGRWF